MPTGLPARFLRQWSAELFRDYHLHSHEGDSLDSVERIPPIAGGCPIPGHSNADMTSSNPKGKRILADDAAPSANPDLPAFIARPEGAPVYHGFPLVPESATDGWCFGVITAFEDDPEGCDWGDAFVVAPDGSRAGLVWAVGRFETHEVCPPEPERWGVYGVAFPKAVRSVADLVECFRLVLPELQAIHAKVRLGTG